MKAKLSNYRQSPRKVRLVADAIRGASIPDARIRLQFLTKRAGGPITKLLDSAVANAKYKGVSEDTLKVSKITVDKGPTLKRSLPRARGMATPINKRTSHVVIELGTK